MDWPTAIASIGGVTVGLGIASVTVQRVFAQIHENKPRRLGVPEHIDLSHSLEQRVQQVEQGIAALTSSLTARMEQLERSINEDIRERRTERKKHESGEYSAAESGRLARIESLLLKMERGR